MFPQQLRFEVSPHMEMRTSAKGDLNQKTIDLRYVKYSAIMILQIRISQLHYEIRIMCSLIIYKT